MAPQAAAGGLASLIKTLGWHRSEQPRGRIGYGKHCC